MTTPERAGIFFRRAPPRHGRGAVALEAKGAGSRVAVSPKHALVRMRAATTVRFARRFKEHAAAPAAMTAEDGSSRRPAAPIPAGHDQARRPPPPRYPQRKRLPAPTGPVEIPPGSVRS